MKDEIVIGFMTASDIWNYFEYEYYSVKRTQRHYLTMSYYPTFTNMSVGQSGETKLFQKKRIFYFLKDSYKYISKYQLNQIDKLSCDDYVVLYRGYKRGTMRNFSWTPNIFIASAFANRHVNGGRIAKAIVKKDNIFGVYHDISEEVIVLNPNDIKIVKTSSNLFDFL